MQVFEIVDKGKRKKAQQVVDDLDQGDELDFEVIQSRIVRESRQKQELHVENV